MGSLLEGDENNISEYLWTALLKVMIEHERVFFSKINFDLRDPLAQITKSISIIMV